MLGYTPPQGLTDAENNPKASRVPSWITKDDVPEQSTQRKGLTKAAWLHKASRMLNLRTKDKENVSDTPESANIFTNSDHNTGMIIFGQSLNKYEELYIISCKNIDINKHIMKVHLVISTNQVIKIKMEWKVILRH